MQELQHEVSSLLEFKNAVLETFPHLHNRFGGAISPAAGQARPLSQPQLYASSPGPNNPQPNNAMSPATNPHVRMAYGSSYRPHVDEDPEWAATNRARGRASKPPPVVIRKSPENSNSSSGSGPTTGLAADSGFNSEPRTWGLPGCSARVQATF